MKSRLSISAIGIPIILSFVWYGGFPFAIALSIVCGLGSWEISRMVIYRNYFSNSKVCFIFSFSVALVIYYLIQASNQENIIGIFLIFFYVISVIWLSTDLLKKSSIINMILGVFSPVFYVSSLMAFAFLIWDMPYGKQWIIILLFSTWAIDSGSFIFGKLLGKTPFFPTVSPNKTLEGALAGYLFGIITTLTGIYFLIPDYHSWITTDSVYLQYSSMILLGIILTISSQIGDLLASVIKRKAKFNSSSGLMKAHGGVLDRIDSIELNLVVLYYFVTWTVI